jgi:hypothetical protein
MIAQRVSVGFRPYMKTQPQRGDRNPFPRDRKHWVASPELDTASEHEADKPQSLEAAKVSVVDVLEFPASTGLKSARSPFTSEVFAERQAHGPGLLCVFASSREPSLLWNGETMGSRLNFIYLVKRQPFRPNVHFSLKPAVHLTADVADGADRRTEMTRAVRQPLPLGLPAELSNVVLPGPVELHYPRVSPSPSIRRALAALVRVGWRSVAYEIPSLLKIQSDGKQNHQQVAEQQKQNISIELHGALFLRYDNSPAEHVAALQNDKNEADPTKGNNS